MAVLLAAMGHTVTGFDASPELIALAAKRAELDGVADRCTRVVHQWLLKITGSNYFAGSIVILARRPISLV